MLIQCTFFQEINTNLDGQKAATLTYRTAFTMGPSLYNLQVVAAGRITWCRLWNMETLLKSYCQPYSCSYALWANINISRFPQKKTVGSSFSANINLLTLIQSLWFWRNVTATVGSACSCIETPGAIISPLKLLWASLLPVSSRFLAGNSVSIPCTASFFSPFSF